MSDTYVISNNSTLRFRQQYNLRQQIKKQFEHYLDPRQVKQLQENPGLLKLGGERKDCTILLLMLEGYFFI